jgi:exopolysaccharide biosynthesis protein
MDVISDAVDWRPTAADGIQWGELHLSGPGEAWRMRVIMARIDPRRVRIRVDSAFDGSIATAGWTIDRAPSDAIVAVNAGQFVGSLPWGWVVIGGNEFLAPGHGPLSTALAIDSSGVLHWAHADGVAAMRTLHGVVSAFQSYPTLLAGDGTLPLQLQPRTADAHVDLGHRDARLAIGQLRDGRVIIALTRLDVPGGMLDYIPLGLTTPEMAALMGALGCSDAVMLDGGISSQMMIRTSSRRLAWRGLRRVPLGLVVLPLAAGRRDGTRATR